MQRVDNTSGSPTQEEVRLVRWESTGSARVDSDVIAVEEPLELRVNGRSVAVVMRTPGQDRELAMGFLLTEGIIRSADDLLDVLLCRDLPEGQSGNVVDVVLAPGVTVDFDRLTRHVFSAASCGLCGKATVDAVFQRFDPIEIRPGIAVERLPELRDRLRQAQPAFGLTGGLHASGLFDRDGALLCVREDVGRHNALDKLIGRAVLDRSLPLASCGVILSGRISFELVQKAAIAGIGTVVGLGAPSSLAVDCAQRGQITLVGFLRENGMNVYTWPERLMPATPVVTTKEEAQ